MSKSQIVKKINFFFILTLIFAACNNDEDKLKTFKGKLVKKGICMNYVIEVKDSDFPQDMLEKKWTDDSSEKIYENPIVTEVKKATPFYIAEEHINYYSQNSNQAYCSYTITPKINKLKTYFNNYIDIKNE